MPSPDLMGNSAYVTSLDEKRKGAEEPDTCRICRGEGTEDEQLFYPCKCSGSIKFVHETCLVEWLSHSQKKYCELCKTPFQFTKLYDPDMPQELPVPLFIKQALAHSLVALGTYLRFGLVAFVWLAWLPWSMRAIWRALFWLADGYWPGAENSQRVATQGSIAQHILNGSAVSTTATSVNVTLSRAAQAAATDIPSSSSPSSYIFSFAAGEPIMLTMVKRAFSTLFYPGLSSFAGLMNSNLTSAAAGSYKQRHPSWLSDVKLLNSLTPSPTFNNILIDTLEGQVITLLVVITFILVFLIREWVVQQQPMVENIADGERDAAIQLIANNPENQPLELPRPEVPHALQPEPGREPAEDDTPGAPGDEDDAYQEPSFSLPGRPVDSDRTRQGDADEQPALPRLNITESELAVHWSSHPQFNHAWPGAETFRDLWARGNGNPEEVLRIIHEEGRQDDLPGLVFAMRALHGTDTYPVLAAGPESAAAGPSSQGRAYLDEGSNSEERADYVPESIEHQTLNGIESSQVMNSERRPISAKSNRSADMNIAGASHYDFAFNFSEPAPNAVNPFESRPSLYTEDYPWPRNSEARLSSPLDTSEANNAIYDDADAEMSEDPGETPEIDGAAALLEKSLTDKFFDFFWGDTTLAERPQEHLQHIEEHEADNLALGQRIANAQNDHRLDEDIIQENQAPDPAAANDDFDVNDVDIVEEGDDLEGILELIGMQGPIFGLLQNGVFGALLISFSLAAGIWLPYLWGKIALVFLDSPVQLMFGVPMAALSIVADVTLDTFIGSLGYVLYWASLLCRMLLGPFNAFIPLGSWIPQTSSVTSASLSLIDASSRRLKQGVRAFFIFHESDIPLFSVLSHQALKMHEARIAFLFKSMFTAGKLIVHDLPLRVISPGLHNPLSSDHNAASLSNALIEARQQVVNFADKLFALMVRTKWINTSMPNIAPARISIDPDLAIWDTKDRIIAIIIGYTIVSFLGFLYLRITGLITGASRGQGIDGFIAEILQQAGGVMKVIIIIGIEMIIFPLYCGSLLDVALLPLFDEATIASRFDFTLSSPLTSFFVHWFIGTCYMFHFALFVSMCRKIMRTGVLYFIRDPDDPNFHPVRDVLERSVASQLRKIAFSALIYGALVMICLGGVVWSLNCVLGDVFPIRWSGTVPILEFPVDLLFYPFVMPFVIRSIKPSDGLHSLYSWWFRKCARLLRLSNFLFGETGRRRDEEGYHVGRTWRDVLSGKGGDVEHPITNDAVLADKGEKAYFVRDGKFVRAPASDQVRIPKGDKAFLEVDDKDGIDDTLERSNDLRGHAGDMFTKVYIPPLFRVRIAAFVFLIWVFAAVSGVGITIVPLVIGRNLASLYFPKSVLMNDVYAFSIGLCAVSGSVCLALYYRRILRAAKKYFCAYLRSPRAAALDILSATLSGFRVAYMFFALCILLPSIFALIMELYIFIPIRSHFGDAEGHVIHFAQDWALGVLYTQMAARVIQWNSTSRVAAALHSIFRNGWLQPNANLATRALVLPVSLVAVAATIIPLSIGFALNSSVFYSSPEIHFKVYRYSFPVTLLFGLSVCTGAILRRRFDLWRANIRDEVYLIGEQLHNFSEKRVKSASVPRRVIAG